jgi:hypothetical protein
VSSRQALMALAGQAWRQDDAIRTGQVMGE